jgi:hypothetical protein
LPTKKTAVGFAASERRRHGGGLKLRLRREQAVDLLQLYPSRVVMTPDREANGDYQAGDQDCHPAAGAEFLIDQYHQDGARHEESRR